MPIEVQISLITLIALAALIVKGVTETWVLVNELWSNLKNLI